MANDGVEIVSGDGEGEFLPEEVHIVESVDEAPYETHGRVDPTYEPAVQQYHAPVAETRSFGSRFWWLIPLLLLLIALPILLHRCNRAEACVTLPPAVWTSAQQDTTWATVSAFDHGALTDDHRVEVLNELVYLCNRRLSGATLGANDVNNQLGHLNYEPAVANNILTLVNGNSFCRCR